MEELKAYGWLALPVVVTIVVFVILSKWMAKKYRSKDDSKEFDFDKNPRRRNGRG